VSVQDFASEAARAETGRAIADVERQTGAEIVVLVRRVSGRYREADYLAGFVLSVVTLLLLLYLPPEFPLALFPVDVVLSFGIGTALSGRLPALRRLFTRKAHQTENVRLAARAAFVDRSLSRLPGRNAVLVYVGLFERRVEVIADVGVRVAGLPGWVEALRDLEAPVASRDLVAFVAALRALGVLLGRVLPRRADDLNELADEPVAC
jgi:putative membrane protein